jgi:asparagine synthase (glutamine-hydrolysing)
MVATLRRRGPDDAGYYHDGRVGLGMRRLSIIDIAGGRQPLYSNSGRYVAVFNGEIYNYRELQQQLEKSGFSFRSHGDGEVVVNMFERFGTESFNHLRGMFAVAIWDTVGLELTLVRDQLGIKPLFYAGMGESLVFGSEMKSILEAIPGSLAVDAQALDALFAYTYIPAPLTIWKEIRKLEPGHYLKWRAGRTSVHRYWDLLDAPTGPELSVPELREALDDSVRAHLVSDVEVGAFLSGGLDSSAIVARMQGCMDSKIRAFSVRFDTRSHLFDETGFAEDLRARYGFNLHVESLPSTEYSAVTDAMQAFDEPFADDSIMPSHAICAMAARHLKVVLSGAGGDEFFGGYNRYQGVVAHQCMATLPRAVHSGIVTPALRLAAYTMGAGSRRGDLLRRFSSDLSRSADEAYLSYVTAATTEVRRRLLAADVASATDPDVTRSLVVDHLSRAANLAPVKRAMYADVKTYLPEDVLALSDRIGMWHSLEIRTPLADRVLAEAAFRLPPADLVTIRSKKVALRRAVAPWLPASILSHPKQGFEGPTASWLRAEGADAVRAALHDAGEAGSAILQRGFVEELLAQHVAGRADHAKKIFSALTAVVWVRLNQARIAGIA